MHCTVCSRPGQISIQLAYQNDARMWITGIAIHLVLQSMLAYTRREQPTNGRPFHRLSQGYIDGIYNNGGYPKEQSILRSSTFSFSVAALTMLNLEVISGDIGVQGRKD